MERSCRSGTQRWGRREGAEWFPSFVMSILAPEKVRSYTLRERHKTAKIAAESILEYVHWCCYWQVAIKFNSTSFFSGFPSDKPSNSLWTTKCRPLLVTNGLIWNQCDAASGSSGSGVFGKSTIGRSPRTAVVGVLSGEKTIRSRQQKVRLNVAVHLTRNIISQIKKWTKNW